MKHYGFEFEKQCVKNVANPSVVINTAKDYIRELQSKLDRMTTIAYNAIQLADHYSKEELEEELGCTEQELLDIADGDEAMINNLGLGE